MEQHYRLHDFRWQAGSRDDLVRRHAFVDEADGGFDGFGVFAVGHPCVAQLHFQGFDFGLHHAQRIGHRDSSHAIP